MFSIHGATGQTFSGTLEQLLRVQDAIAPRCARAADKDNVGLLQQHPDISSRSGREVENLAHAANEYRKMLPRAIERSPILHAYQIMSRNVLTINANDTVVSAWEALAVRQVHQAPVLNLASGLVGMVSDRDLLTVIDLRAGRPIGRLDHAVSEVMATPIVCADPVTDVRRIARVLVDTGLSALPVISESRDLLGVVSRGDILRAATADPPLSLWT